jgi:2-oxo-3-hexenedioate decarboxylase
VTHPRVVSGLRAALEDWRTQLDRGAKRIGWKIGLNIPEVQKQLGIDEPVIGYLTSATLVEPGGTYAAGDAVRLMAEPEVALEIGRDVAADVDIDAAREAVAALAPALELVDTGRPPEGGVEAIVAENVFHRAVVLGASRPAFPVEGSRAELRVNDEERESAEAVHDFADVVELTARLLSEAGEELLQGDRIIAGSLTPQVQVAPGYVVAVEVTGVGSVEARVAP